MCGITGYIDYNNNSSKEILQNMLDVIRHRCPDDSGLQINTAGNAAIGLAHSRLSILDLSTNGHQPMSFEQYQVVYNGEIYNFKAIRDGLKNLGYKFTTECDTEVLLKAFHKWQFKAIDKFIGMFAFAIYDKQQNRLSLVRDRAGVKPLYYYWDGKRVTTYGFKMHSNVDEDGFVKKMTFTPGDVHDSKELNKLVKTYKGKNQSATKDCGEVYVDGAYADKDNDEKLGKQNNKVLHRAYRNKPLTEQQKQENKRRSSIRYIVERTLGYLNFTMDWRKQDTLD